MTPYANQPVWDDGAWEGLPALAGDLAADACVVGLGGSGLAAVHALLDAGQRVIGLDAGAVAGAAAGRNGGFLIAGLAAFHHEAAARHGADAAAALYRLTMEEIGRIAAETPDAVRRTGSLRIAASEDERADCQAQLAAMQRDDLPAEWYDGPEGSGLLFPGDGVFQPMRRCRTLARRALARGARLFEHTRARGLGTGLVDTERGRISCERVIVAVDGGLDHLLPELAPRVRTARLQMVATAPAPMVRFPRPVYTRWGYDYWQQLPDERIVFGGFRDTALEAEWTSDATPTAGIQQAQERFLRDGLGVPVPITHRWAAIIAFTSDGLPVLEDVRPGVWATGAYSGTGNVLGAAGGRAAAQLALGQRPALARLLDGARAGT